MTLAEFAIARVAGQLVRDAGKRELTPDEWRLLHKSFAGNGAHRSARSRRRGIAGIVHRRGAPEIGKYTGGYRVNGRPLVSFGNTEVAMLNIRFALLLLAFLSLGAAAVGVPSRVNLVAAGLALWVLAVIIG